MKTLNHLYPERDKSSRQKISQGMLEFNSTINQLEIIDIYRLVHLIKADYTLFLNSHGPFTKIVCILGQKTHLNKFKRIKILKSALR
jgi:hypothetical protein